MPAIRCQSCGKPNPDFLETCQYCDARLKPLTAPLTPPAESAPAVDAPAPNIIRCQSCGKPNPSTVETCQYCDARLKPLTSELRAPGGADEQIIKCQSCGKPNPVTLDTCQYCDARLRPATEELKAANARPAPTEWLVASREPAPAETTPDWVKSMPSAPPVPPAENLPDWLRTPAAPEAAEPAAPAAMEEMPDWLRALRTSSPIVAAPPTQAALPETPPAGADWASTRPQAPAEDSEMPEWLRAMSAPAETPAAQPASDVPDWMSSLREAAPAQPEAEIEAEAPIAATPADEMPDWLRAMSAPAETPAAQPASDVPDWMSALREAAPTEPEAEIEAEAPIAATPADEMPDWLRAMSAPAETPAAQPASDVPDWMSALREAAPAQPEAEVEAEAPIAATPAEELPDWLRASSESAPASAEAAEPEPVILHPDEEEEGGANDAWLQALPSTATPEWLGQIGVGPVDFEAPLASKAAEEPPAPPAEEMPEWMQTLQPAAELPPLDSTPAPEATPSAPEEAPDWLRALRAGAPAQEAAPEGESTGLEQSALPTWLAAMRPVDVPSAHISEEADVYEERVGVLAGMRGVLRAEPVVAQPHKSTVQVHKLTLTPAQAQQEALLRALVQEDTQPQAAPKRRRSLLPVIERWVVTVILLAAVLVPLFVLPGGSFPLPDTIGQETKAAFNTIEALPADKPVLLVFDYDPAQAGELNPGALAVAAHLARKGAPLVGLSPRVAGAAVGDAVLEEAAASVAYDYGTHYLNLGYLPGGPVGVAQAALALRAALPVDFRGQFADVWRSPLLSPIEALEDFSAIVIISASPDGAQRWLEQAQPRAPEVKFIAVVSAGAEPLVRPYAEGAAPQLSGLVSGRIGAAKYEAQAGTGRNATEASVWQWDALGGGLAGAATLLLLGNLIFGTASFVRRRKR